MAIANFIGSLLAHVCTIHCVHIDRIVALLLIQACSLLCWGRPWSRGSLGRTSAGSYVAPACPRKRSAQLKSFGRLGLCSIYATCMYVPIYAGHVLSRETWAIDNKVGYRIPDRMHLRSIITFSTHFNTWKPTRTTQISYASATTGQKNGAIGSFLTNGRSNRPRHHVAQRAPTPAFYQVNQLIACPDGISSALSNKKLSSAVRRTTTGLLKTSGSRSLCKHFQAREVYSAYLQKTTDNLYHFWNAVPRKESIHW